jgi:hypothetical protein
MPAGATYEPLATTTTSGVSSYTFSGISGSYTDLKIIFTGKLNSGAGVGNIGLRFNGDTSTNYSITRIVGTGSSALSSRFSNFTYMLAGYGTGDTHLANHQFNIFSYAGSTNKTVLMLDSEDMNGSVDGSVSRVVGLWRSTSAITSVTVITNTGTFDTGTTITLYGIKAA